MTFKLLSTGNPKVLKGQTQGYMTFILHLAPYTLSGHNTCPKATPGCAMACLNTAGRGGMFRKGENTNVIQKARIRKTQWFYADRASFMATLVSDIQKAIRYAEKRGYLPVFRLNGTSDLSWEKYSVIRDGVQYNHIFDAFSGVQFYDYTKVLGRKVKDIWNYHLTFSKAESNDFDTRLALSNGMNVAVVFSTKKSLPLPATYMNRTVFNGDDSDLRFLTLKAWLSACMPRAAPSVIPRASWCKCERVRSIVDRFGRQRTCRLTILPEPLESNLLSR